MRGVLGPDAEYPRRNAPHLFGQAHHAVEVQAFPARVREKVPEAIAPTPDHHADIDTEGKTACIQFIQHARKHALIGGDKRRRRIPAAVQRRDGFPPTLQEKELRASLRGSPSWPACSGKPT